MQPACPPEDVPIALSRRSAPSGSVGATTRAAAMACLLKREGDRQPAKQQAQEEEKHGGEGTQPASKWQLVSSSERSRQPLASKYLRIARPAVHRDQPVQANHNHADTRASVRTKRYSSLLLLPLLLLLPAEAALLLILILPLLTTQRQLGWGTQAPWPCTALSPSTMIISWPRRFGVVVPSSC